MTGDDFPAAQLTAGHYDAVMHRWDQRAPATWNKHLTALRSFAAYAARQEWLTVDPSRHLERRKITKRGDKAILAALGHYVRLGEETSARITAENDTLNRRRHR